MAQIQALACACNGYIHQAALFFQAVKVVEGVFVRKQPFFQPADKYHVKFQPFGGMHGHELHGVLPRLGLVVARFQRGMGQKGRQR